MSFCECASPPAYPDRFQLIANFTPINLNTGCRERKKHFSLFHQLLLVDTRSPPPSSPFPIFVRVTFTKDHFLFKLLQAFLLTPGHCDNAVWEQSVSDEGQERTHCPALMSCGRVQRFLHSRRLLSNAARIPPQPSVLRHVPLAQRFGYDQLTLQSQRTCCRCMRTARLAGDLLQQLAGWAVVRGLIASQSSQAWETQRGGGVRYSKEFFHLEFKASASGPEQDNPIMPWVRAVHTHSERQFTSK